MSTVPAFQESFIIRKKCTYNFAIIGLIFYVLKLFCESFLFLFTFHYVRYNNSYIQLYS